MAWRASTSSQPFLGALGSRVGRRTLFLFVVCALLPITLMAGWSYLEVRRSLVAEAQDRIESAAKEHAVSIVGRVHTLRDFFLAARGSDSTPTAHTLLQRVWLAPPDSAQRLLAAVEQSRLRSGGVALLIDPDSATRFLMTRILNPGRQSSPRVWGDVDLTYLWGFAEGDVLTPGMCVVQNKTRRVLVCSSGVTESERLVALDTLASRATNPGAFLTARREAFFGYELGGGGWQVVTVLRRDEVLDVVGGFGRTFALIAGLSMLVVFFVSHVQIRRITAPLEQLHDATRRVADGEFAATPLVTSDDEFGALARSFNAMSGALGRQFSALQALDEVDRLAMGTHDLSAVVGSAQRGVAECCRAPRVVAAVRATEMAGARWRVFDYSDWHSERDSASEVPIDSAAHVIQVGVQPREVDAPGDLQLLGHLRAFTSPACTETLFAMGVQDARGFVWLMLPLWHAGRLEGLLAVGTFNGVPADSDEAIEARRLADRLAIAVANVRLVHQLDALGLGTLTAFARAIDANSHWTAGHSERVTEMAVALGERVGVGADDIETLRRGGLLHDIGKIGVPALILNKPGRLTIEEFEVMKSHPVLGHRILAPIAAFHDALPVVRSHHERMDGSGYPDGLPGEQIPYLARILAVADVYDALVSDRPYRPGLTAAQAVSEVRRSAGAHLDPTLVHHFLELHAEGGVIRESSALCEAEALAFAVGAGRARVEVPV